MFKQVSIMGLLASAIAGMRSTANQVTGTQVPRHLWTTPGSATATHRRTGLGVKANQRAAIKRRNRARNRLAHR